MQSLLTSTELLLEGKGLYFLDISHEIFVAKSISNESTVFPIIDPIMKKVFNIFIFQTFFEFHSLLALIFIKRKEWYINKEFEFLLNNFCDLILTSI